MAWPLAILFCLARCGEPIDEAGSGAPQDAANAPKDTSDPRLDRALELIVEGRHGEARSLLAKVQEDRPDDGRAMFYLGLTYHREKRYEIARESFERALDLGPTFSSYDQAHHFYGWCLYKLGRVGEARRAFEKHIESQPDAVDSHFATGLIALEEGEFDLAEKRFRKAVDLERQNRKRKRQLAKAHMRLGDVYLAQDQLERAKEELLLATRLWPQLYPAHYKLYRVLTRLGESEAAAAALRAHQAWRRRVEQRTSADDPEGAP